MQAAAVEGLEEPALSGLSIGAESGAASLPGPTPTADMSAADLASLQHDFTRLGAHSWRGTQHCVALVAARSMHVQQHGVKEITIILLPHMSTPCQAQSDGH